MPTRSVAHQRRTLSGPYPGQHILHVGVTAREWCNAISLKPSGVTIQLTRNPPPFGYNKGGTDVVVHTSGHRTRATTHPMPALGHRSASDYLPSGCGVKADAASACAEAISIHDWSTLMTGVEVVNTQYSLVG